MNLQEQINQMAVKIAAIEIVLGQTLTASYLDALKAVEGRNAKLAALVEMKKQVLDYDQEAVGSVENSLGLNIPAEKVTSSISAIYSKVNDVLEMMVELIERQKN